MIDIGSAIIYHSSIIINAFSLLLILMIVKLSSDPDIWSVLFDRLSLSVHLPGGICHLRSGLQKQHTYQEENRIPLCFFSLPFRFYPLRRRRSDPGSHT